MASSQDLGLMNAFASWPRHPHYTPTSDQCEDPFASITSDPWTKDDSTQQRRPSLKFANVGNSFSFSPFQQKQQLQSVVQNGASTSSQQQMFHEVQSWSPQQSDDPLQKFRTSLQSGELSKLSESHIPSLNIYNHQRRRSESFHRQNGFVYEESSLSSAGSTDSDSTPTPPLAQTTWSAIVQKNPRPVKQNQRQRPSKTVTITLAACCATPKIKLICGCCNEETQIKLKEELKPRMIPVSTSQLGFCRFCQTNGDPPEIYQSHSLRSDDGKVTCPVLREYNCPICNNGGGDFAHTIKYCPMARKAKPGQ